MSFKARNLVALGCIAAVILLLSSALFEVARLMEREGPPDQSGPITKLLFAFPFLFIAGRMVGRPKRASVEI